MRRGIDRFGWIMMLLGGAALCAGCSESGAVTPKIDAALSAKIREGSATGGGATQAAAVVGTGWGTLKGTFKLQGAAPSLAPLDTGGKNVEVCGEKIPNDALIVDSATQGIANIVIYPRKVARVFDGEGAAPVPAVFDQKKCMFTPHVLGADIRVPLIMKNSDPVSHNTNFSPQGNTSSNATLATNAEMEYKFTRPLQYPAPATCSIHPWMKGYILGRSDPYFAVTAADGSFEIKNLPAGEPLEFQVWHELSKGANGALPAKAEWSKGQFKVTIPENGVEDLGEIQVASTNFQ